MTLGPHYGGEVTLGPHYGGEVTEVEDVARALARRHGVNAEPDLERSLLRYAESPRVGDWTLRSAVVRLAQPQPELANLILEAVRRCDGALHGRARSVLVHSTWTDRGLVTGDRDDPCAAMVVGPQLVDAVADARVTDLARLARACADEFPALLRAYEELQPLDEDERAALAPLGIALELDALADVLAAWANAGHQDPPVAVAASSAASANERLDGLGIARETGRTRAVIG